MQYTNSRELQILLSYSCSLVIYTAHAAGIKLVKPKRKETKVVYVLRVIPYMLPTKMK